MHYVGIDVSKNKLDICLLYDGVKGKRKTKSLLNNEHSACMLIAWLAKYIPALQQVNIVMEATGVYHERLAYSLHQAGGRIAIANPLRVRDFAKGMGILTKTDKVDAYILALLQCLKTTRCLATSSYRNSRIEGSPMPSGCVIRRYPA
ncbi:protein of unknown function [Xenorhabdus bovienii]|uniref:Transposase IS110-like N-terminal domain-containing protein n=1 Tax=Xenorhabdus bovienii TaxID=40576 RepID=A0A0B6X2Y9_XENBV|nr:protein of unknown function [Xenorhabdus bovienii]